MEHGNGNTYAAEGDGSSMGVPYLTSFLWCMSLKVGARLTGIMHCMFSASVVVVCSLMAHEAGGYLGSPEDADGVYSRAFYTTLVVAAVSVVHVALACVLLYGVFWRKPSLLRLWVVVMSALLVASVLFVVVTALVCGLSATGSDIFIGFIQALLVFAFIGYCILCVYSYYLMLKSTDEMERPNKIDY